MKFNIVVGNPPYNNDLYLDFVQQGHKLSTDYTLMITPAKWQAKGGHNEKFRKTIVPYMSKIVYYPDCSDIFNINEYSGITYYLCDKYIHNEKIIKNISYKNNNLCNKCNRSSINPLNNTGNSIIGKLSNNRITKFCYTENDMYAVVGVNRFAAERGVKGTYQAYGTISYTTKNTAVIREPRLIEMRYRATELSTADIIVMSSNNKEECESFISFMNTKFIRFLLFINICGNSPVYSRETWRFVPAPDAFDHIFTDKELYEKYNLTQDEINIIESVIKERK